MASPKKRLDALAELGSLMIGGMRQPEEPVRRFLASLKPEDAAKLLAEAESMNARPLMKAFSDFGSLPAPAPRIADEIPPPPTGRDPVPFEQRIAGNTTLRTGLDELGIPTEGMSQEQILEAAAQAFKADGAPRGRPKKAAPPPPIPSSPLAGRVAGRQRPEDIIRELIPEQPVRQFELPFGEEPTGLIPYGVRGPGVPQGGLMGPGTLFDSGERGLIRAPLRGLPEPDPTGLIPRGERGLVPLQGEIIPRPRGGGRIPPGGPPPRGRVIDAEPPRRIGGDVEAPRSNRKAKLAAAAVAAGAGAAALAPEMLNDDSDVVSGGEADLVAESRPAPQVAATADVPEPTVAQAPRDYSMEARALINRLNDMRRAAGGEVPEAPAMMAEINRLLELGNQTRRATAVAAPQDDASRLFQQAQALIDQVNQMYRQGMTPNSPEVRQVMAQVRQLQAQGDALRNRRAG